MKKAWPYLLAAAAFWYFFLRQSGASILGGLGSGGAFNSGAAGGTNTIVTPGASGQSGLLALLGGGSGNSAGIQASANLSDIAKGIGSIFSGIGSGVSSAWNYLTGGSNTKVPSATPLSQFGGSAQDVTSLDVNPSDVLIGTGGDLAGYITPSSPVSTPGSPDYTFEASYIQQLLDEQSQQFSSSVSSLSQAPSYYNYTPSPSYSSPVATYEPNPYTFIPYYDPFSSYGSTSYGGGVNSYGTGDFNLNPGYGSMA